MIEIKMLKIWKKVEKRMKSNRFFQNYWPSVKINPLKLTLVKVYYLRVLPLMKDSPAQVSPIKVHSRAKLAREWENKEMVKQNFMIKSIFIDFYWLLSNLLLVDVKTSGWVAGQLFVRSYNVSLAENRSVTNPFEKN